MRFEIGSIAVRLIFPLLLLIAFGARLPVHSATGRGKSKSPVVLSVQMENGSKVYRLNGRRVENSVENSMLTNLGRIVRGRGTRIPAIIIVDVRAPLSEVDKLETALDKSGITQSRVFVTNFKGGTMNEIHWDETPVPLPPYL